MLPIDNDGVTTIAVLGIWLSFIIANWLFCCEVFLLFALCDSGALKLLAIPLASRDSKRFAVRAVRVLVGIASGLCYAIFLSIGDVVDDARPNFGLT